jgi:glycosyltransferase involved in cell wall biosynthesis
MTKVLFVLTPAFSPNSGGVQHTTFKLGKYFTEQGLEVHYFSFAATGHVIVNYGELHHPVGSAEAERTIEMLKSLITRLAPDVVINQMPYENRLRDALFKKRQQHSFLLLGCLRNALFSVKNNLPHYAELILPRILQRFFKNPLGYGILLLGHKRKHKRALKEILDKHDYFVLLTPPNREELKYFVGNYKADKTIVIPNSIPDVHFDGSHKEKIILHVGRLNIPQKRSDLLLEVWRKIYHQLPDWEFVIVGDGPYKSSMEDQIRREKLPRVSLTGYQKPDPYYQKAALFLMPSAFEGFPNVLLEAQSFGVVPVVFNSYPALPWIVEHGMNARLVTAFDTEQMGLEIVNLSGDSLTLERMSEASIRNAEKFTIDKVGQMWLSFFKQKTENA